MPAVPFSWSDVLLAVSAFLGAPLVVGGLVAVMGTDFARFFIDSLRAIFAYALGDPRFPRDEGWSWIDRLDVYNYRREFGE